MITAQEAKLIADKANASTAHEAYVSHQIEKSAKMGGYAIMIEKPIIEAILHDDNMFFEKKGYRLYTDDTMVHPINNMPCYCIRFD